MRVIGLGVSCTVAHISAGSFAFSLQEFACLDDDTRVAFRSDRGCGFSHRPEGDPLQLAESELLHHVSMALLPDEGIEEDAGERLPFHEYSELLGQIGISASAGSLKSCPFIVDLAPEVRQLIALQ